MQRDAAGMATVPPTTNLVAARLVSDGRKVKTVERLPMSHQTGALLMTSVFQSIELMNQIRHIKPVQIMYRQVPVFHAGQRVRECDVSRR